MEKTFQSNNSFLNDVKIDKFAQSEEEDVVDQKILYMICIIIIAGQLNHLLERYFCGINKYF